MITSPVVLGKAVEDRSIQGLALYRKNSVDPVQWLSDTLKVSGGSGELVRVSLRSEDTEGTKEIVDAVLVAFDREVIERARTEKLNDVESLEKKYKSYQTQVFDKKRTLYNLSLQLGTGDSSTATVQYKMQVDSLDTLLRLRSDLQRQIADVEFKASMAKIQQDLDKKPSADPRRTQNPKRKRQTVQNATDQEDRRRTFGHRPVRRSAAWQGFERQSENGQPSRQSVRGKGACTAGRREDFARHQAWHGANPATRCSSRYARGVGSCSALTATFLPPEAKKHSINPGRLSEAADAASPHVSACRVCL